MSGTFAAKKEGAAFIFESLYKLLPVVLPLVQQYFAPNLGSVAADKTNTAPNINGRYAEAAA